MREWASAFLPEIKTDQFVLAARVEQPAGQGGMRAHDKRQDLRARGWLKTGGGCRRKDEFALLRQDQELFVGESDRARFQRVFSPTDLAGLEFNTAERGLGLKTG